VIARERLHELLDGARDRDTNIISDLVAAISELVVQELVEGEQADFLGGRGHYQWREHGQGGFRNGYEPRRIRTAEGPLSVRLPQVRGAGGPFRSTLMSFVEGNSEVLDRLVVEMYARGMSTRDIEDAFPWEGWLYLASVIDIASRRVVGHALADHLRTELVTGALGNALAARDPGPGVIFHSDRGGQYTSAEFRRSGLRLRRNAVPWPHGPVLG
jgi:hypothetical protein